MAWDLTPEYEREIRRNWADNPFALEEQRSARLAIAALLAEIDRLRADRVREQTRSTQVLNRLRAEADKVTDRVGRAEAAVNRVWSVKVWTNEDGRRFLFADDIEQALAPDVAAKLGRTAAEGTPPYTASEVGRG